ncbi:MAG TPA: glycosyltransferase [Nitrospiraceae bacterium]|nr:glycosyltransferase [Nitrospiraceae bacterium]
MTLKVAIVHDWLTAMRGGERCLEVMCELFPDADIFTLVHRKGQVSPAIEKHSIRTSFVQRLPFAFTHYQYYLPVFPLAITSFDFHEYDLVVSSSHCVAKGLLVPTNVCHVSYVYTPMRYIWDQFDAYFSDGRAGWLTRTVMGVLRRHLQRWDVSSNDGVYRFVAISEHVAHRIKSYWGRESTVLYPPVDWQSFTASDRDEGFYLLVSALVPYKRVDLAIQAANRMKLPLKIIGVGQDEHRLRQLAGPSVEMLGWQPDSEIRQHYSRCKALLFPGEEDFGIVPLEAMACGKPVIAYAKGGALETVVSLAPCEAFARKDRAVGMSTRAGEEQYSTGVFFDEQKPESLVEAIELFERNRSRFDPEKIRAHVEPFDRKYFKERMRQLIETSWNDFRRTHLC